MYQVMFPGHTYFGYWHEMIKKNDPLPVFKIQGRNCVILSIQYDPRAASPVGATCEVCFVRVYSPSEIHCSFKGHTIKGEGSDADS